MRAVILFVVMLVGVWAYAQHVKDSGAEAAYAAKASQEAARFAAHRAACASATDAALTQRNVSYTTLSPYGFEQTSLGVEGRIKVSLPAGKIMVGDVQCRVDGEGVARVSLSY